MEMKQHATKKQNKTKNRSVRNSKRKLKNTLRQTAMKTRHSTSIGSCESGSSALRRELTVIQTFLIKEKSQISNLTCCLKEVEKEQTKPKVSRRKDKDLRGNQ